MSETRKLAAILVADVVGYSRLAGADEDRTLARLRGLRSDLVDPAIAAHHGRIVKRTGDGSIIEFRSVVDAVRCAIEMQNGLIERNAGVPEDRRIEFRVGIHVGDVVEESDGDLMGDGVNIAARLEGIAKPGAICLSEDAYRQVSGRLEMEVTDLGPTQLKNIDRQIRAYSLQVGVPAKPKPAKAAEPVTPAAPTPQKRRFGLAPLAAALAALLVVVAGGAWWFLDANRPASVAAKAPAEAARLSIVVLPFANLSGDPGQDYLVDALTDELTTSLARIRDTFVIARNTAMTFKGKPVDAKAIGKDLGVRYVLEGSVQPSGDRMRVNAQLIDAGSGAHLWAEQFDTPRADLLQTQDAIVAHLANAHRPSTRLGRGRTRQTDARGQSRRRGLGSPVPGGRAEGRMDRQGGGCGIRALRTGARHRSQQCPRPDGIGDQVLAAGGAWPFRRPERRPRAGRRIGVEGARPRSGFRLGSRHEGLHPSDPGAHRGSRRRTRARARPGPVRRGRRRRPGRRRPSASGEFDKSLEYLDKAIRASPYDPSLTYWYGGKAWANFGLKRYDQAIELARRAIAINPYNPYAHVVLVARVLETWWHF